MWSFLKKLLGDPQSADENSAPETKELDLQAQIEIHQREFRAAWQKADAIGSRLKALRRDERCPRGDAIFVENELAQAEREATMAFRKAEKAQKDLAVLMAARDAQDHFLNTPVIPSLELEKLQRDLAVAREVLSQNGQTAEEFVQETYQAGPDLSPADVLRKNAVDWHALRVIPKSPQAARSIEPQSLFEK